MDMVEALISNLISLKSERSFEEIDFEADLVSLYGDIRKMMAANYNDFGPVNIQLLDTDFMSKEELMLYKKMSITRINKSKMTYQNQN